LSLAERTGAVPIGRRRYLGRRPFYLLNGRASLWAHRTLPALRVRRGVVSLQSARRGDRVANLFRGDAQVLLEFTEALGRLGHLDRRGHLTLERVQVDFGDRLRLHALLLSRIRRCP